MSQYLPVVSWSTIASNVTLGATAYRYYITVNPLDPNEAGASPMTVAINDWFIDFAGYPFLIENVAGSVLTVYDILERGDGIISAYAPYADKLGYVYRPLNGAIILTQAQLRKLDESAKDIIQPIEKGIIYKQLFQLNQTNPQTVYGGIPIFSTGLNTDFVDFNLLTEALGQEGRLKWSAEDGTLEVGLPGGSVNLQIGQEQVIRVYNEESITIPNGSVVYASSASGNIKKVKLANNNVYAEATHVIGMATENIESGHFGYITTIGLVHDVDTDGGAVGGQFAYLGLNGAITITEPDAPNTKVIVGVIVRPHATEGIIYVNFDVTPRLQDLSDVYGNPTVSGQFPSWDSGNSRFNFDKNINDYATLEIFEDSGNPTGFINNSGITVSYDYTTRKITLTGDLSYYWKGTKKTLTSPWTSSAHTATLGSWYLYSTDGDNFTWSQTRWSFYDIQVSYVNYGTSAATTFATREVHGLMDTEGHIEAHDNIGTYRVSGGNATAGTYALSTGTDAAITPGFDAAVVKDEDISTTIPAWTEGTYSTMYVNSTTSSSTFSLTESFPFLYTPASYITYNNITAGTLVTGAVNRWFNVYQILIPTTSDADSQKYRTIFLQPQVEHTSLLSATGEDVRGLNLGALANLSPEFVFWARLTYYTGASYTTTGKVQLVSITYVTGNKANQITVSGFNPTNHAALSNLQWTLSGHIGTENTLPAFNYLGTASNILSTNVKLYGATGNGITDDTSAIQSALTSGTDVYFPAGTYIVSNLTIVNDGTHIHGDGISSILQFKSGSTDKMIECSSSRVYIENIRLTGNYPADYQTTPSTGVNRTGLSIASSKNSIVSNITVDGFENTGIFVNETGTTTILERFIISNCHIRDCYIGIDTGLDGENYTRYSGLNINRCYIGYKAGEGNINLTNSNIYKNYYGLYLDGTRLNDGHSIASNCILNHNTYPIYTTDIAHGYTFVGNQIYDGIIYLNTSTGVFFTGCSIGVDEIWLSGGGLNWFISNHFVYNYANAITHNYGGVTDYTRFENNHLDTDNYIEDKRYAILYSDKLGIDQENPQYDIDICSTSASDTSSINLGVYNLVGEGGGVLWKSNYPGTTKISAAIKQAGEGSFFRSGIAFYTGNVQNLTTDAVERMRINMNGNIGIGTSDIESWNTSYRALEFGRSALMAGVANTSMLLMSNAYFDGVWKYKTTASAGVITTTGNTFSFRATPSGTLDTEITWTTPFQIDSDGYSTFASSVAIGTTPSAYHKLRVIDTQTDPISGSSNQTNYNYPTYTGAETASETYYGLRNYVYPIINGGHTNSGNNINIYSTILRNANGASADDNGTLTGLYGLQLLYGHNNTNSSATPTTTTAYGIYVAPYYKTGVITNMYDIYLASEVAGGTATNRWGLYQANNKNNRFEGNIGIKKTPTVELDVSGTILTTTIKISSGATSGYYWKCTNADGTGVWAAVNASSVYKGTVDGDDGKINGTATVLIDGTGTTGDYYRCIDAGTYDYGNPSGNSITLAVGDDIYYNGTQWQKIPGAGGYILPPATNSTLGGVIIGSGVSVDGSGIISVSTAYREDTWVPDWTDITNIPSPVDTLGGLSLVQGDMLYASATDTLNRLAKSTTTNSFLKNGGTDNNPIWSTISTSEVSEGTNLYFTNARVIISLLTGYTATSGTISAADSILQAIQKLGYDKHVAVTLATNNGLSLTGQVLAMGTPSTLTSATKNEVTNTTHTHAITAGLGFIGNGSAQYQVPVTGATPFTPTWTTATKIFGTTGLNSLTYASTAFVKMTGTNTFSLDTNTYLTANQTITLSGAVTGSGTTAITTSLATPETITGSTTNTGGTGAHTHAISLSFDNLTDVVLTTPNQGSVLYFNGTNWVNLAPGTNGYFLKTQGVGANPVWAASTATPGGSSTYVQFNDGGVFGGTSGLVFDKTTNTLTCTGRIIGNNLKSNLTSLSTKVGYNVATNENETAERRNVIIGYVTGANLTTAESCTLVGFNAGNTLITNGGAVMIGHTAGKYESAANKLFIDSIDRGNEATSRTASLVYGEFNSTVNLQKIYLNASTYTKRVVKAYQALTSASAVTMNVRDGQNARITLGHNVTLTLSNLEDGDEGNIVVIQDATGSRTLTISPTPKVIDGGGGTITLTGTANSIDMLSYTYANSVLYITYGKNYS